MEFEALSFPADLHYHVEHQVWARVAGGMARVGISSLGIRLAGEVYMCRPKLVGSVVAQGQSLAVVELAKSIVSVKSPVHGEVVAVNPRLAATPELVHLDPSGEGWLAELRLVDFAGDQAGLLFGEPVLAAMRQHAWLHKAQED